MNIAKTGPTIQGNIEDASCLSKSTLQKNLKLKKVSSVGDFSLCLDVSLSTNMTPSNPSFYRPHPKDGGRYYFQSVHTCEEEGVPHPRSGWGVPCPRSVGGGVTCPRSGWGVPQGPSWPDLDGGGYLGSPPQPGLGGGTPSQVCGWGGTPSQVCGWGVPHPRSGGYPSQGWMGGTPGSPLARSGSWGVTQGTRIPHTTRTGWGTLPPTH